MTFIIPEHNPLEEQVAFPLHAAFFEEADVPFFIERTGRIVPRADPRPAIEDWLGERYVVLICDVPMGDGEILNLNDPQSRKEHCLHWR
jgi:hypothetical protein